MQQSSTLSVASCQIPTNDRVRAESEAPAKKDVVQAPMNDQINSILFLPCFLAWSNMEVAMADEE
jgi:hypothetical protein